MAQLAESDTTERKESNGFGYCERVEFGRYKGTENANVYKIANLGDYKYLTWILNCNNKKRAGEESVFKIHPSVLPHAAAAMRTKGEVSKWQCSFEQDPVDTTLWRKQYVTDDGKLEGPQMLYRTCGLCNKRKSIEVMHIATPRKSICKNCYGKIFDN